MEAEKKEEGGVMDSYKNYKKMKFSEMPGFGGYKEALEKAGVFIEDRTVGFTVPDSIDNEMYEQLWVMDSRCMVRDLYTVGYDEELYGPRYPELANAKVVHCRTLFAYGEWAVVESNWQWLVVDGRYEDDSELKGTFHWCSSYAWPAQKFNEVMKDFNEGKLQADYTPLNTTDWTTSVLWLEWLINDVLEFVQDLREEGK